MICKFVKYEYIFDYAGGPHPLGYMAISAYSLGEAEKQLKFKLSHIWDRVGWHNVSLCGTITEE